MSKQSGSTYAKTPGGRARDYTIAVDSHFATPIPLRSPPKTKYVKHGTEKYDRPDIETGMKITVRVNEGSTCKGYFGCVVVDWHERGTSSKWSMSTRIICQVMGTSQEEHKDMVGRLICCEVFSWSSAFWGGYGVVDMSNKNWSKYKIVID